MSGPFSQGTFDDQFDSVGGDNTMVEYSLTVPFDCVLRRASVCAFAASANDAYITIELNGEEIIVEADGLLADVNVLGKDIEVPASQGDKLTVKLNLVSSNVVKRAKVVVAYAVRVSRDVVAPGYYPTYAY